MNEYGELISADTVRFERLLPGPIERVWSYIVDGQKRAQWLCGGATELEVGGHIDLEFHNATLSDDADDEPPEEHAKYDQPVSFYGKVTRCEPPTVFAHTWVFEDDHSEVCYELREQGDKVLLVLTHSRLRSLREKLSVCGGWHTHLGVLSDVLEGRQRRPFWKTHSAMEAEYERRLS